MPTSQVPAPRKTTTVNSATHLLDDYSNSSICLSINSTYTDGKQIKDIYIYILFKYIVHFDDNTIS